MEGITSNPERAQEERRTIQYYNQNAKAYFENTVHADMSSIYPQFLKYIKPGGSIVDLGAGSGRDLFYFKNAGFQVSGIDASEELCRIASKYSGAPVSCCRIQDWRPERRYDGIWANASLLHLASEEIFDFIRRAPDFLNADGAAYISLKTGISTGSGAEGRYFTNIEERDLKRAFAESGTKLKLAEYWRTEDSLGRSDTKWLNIIACLVDSCSPGDHPVQTDDLCDSDRSDYWNCSGRSGGSELTVCQMVRNYASAVREQANVLRHIM